MSQYQKKFKKGLTNGEKHDNILIVDTKYRIYFWVFYLPFSKIDSDIIKSFDINYNKDFNEYLIKYNPHLWVKS